MNPETILKIKRGYLKEDFRYFHLIDKKNMEFQSHYHDFNKIIIFISGNVNYLIEGKSYKLKPWDIILVNSNEVHKPVISEKKPYERIIIWLNELFLKKHNNKNCDLMTCFKIASDKKKNLLRLDYENILKVKSLLKSIEFENSNNYYGNYILKNSLVIQFIVMMNRFLIENKIDDSTIDVKYDKRVVDILEYINSNLNDNLSIENISKKFFINRYYLMHKFKEQTGYTIHSYILQKRLIKAASLIKQGGSIMYVCMECGFGDYSSFERSFKKMFELSPKNYAKAIKEIEKKG